MNRFFRLFIDIFKNEKNEVNITIKDNAGGIPKDIIHKIFDFIKIKRYNFGRN